MSPRWAAFTGLTLVVLVLLLVLARLSQAAVRDAPPALPAGDESRSGPDDDVQREPIDGESEESTSPASGEAGEPPVDTGTTDEDAETTPPTGDVPSDGPAPTDGMPATGESANLKSEPPPGDEASPQDGPTNDLESPAGEAGPEMSTGILLANVVLTQGIFGALLAVGAWYFEIPAAALGLGGTRSGVGALLVGLGFGVVLWLGNEVAAYAADAVGAAYDEELRAMLAPDSVAGWGLLFGVVLPVVALAEELLFRASLVGVPAAGFGTSPWALAVVSSAAFALGHGAQGRVGIAVTGGLGFALAAGFVLTGSFVVVVVAHYLVNALEFLVHEVLDMPRLLA